jgi:hypothetical protein
MIESPVDMRDKSKIDESDNASFGPSIHLHVAIVAKPARRQPGHHDFFCLLSLFGVQLNIMSFISQL